MSSEARAGESQLRFVSQVAPSTPSLVTHFGRETPLTEFEGEIERLLTQGS